MSLCDKNYYLANVTKKEVIKLMHPDEAHKIKLWNQLIDNANSGVNWNFIGTPTSNKDDIKFTCNDQTMEQLVAKGYTDLSWIADSVFQDEDEDSDIDEFTFDENDQITLKIKRRSAEQLKRLSVKDLRAYAKDLRTEARLMMCPSVAYSKLKKDDLITLILICKKLGEDEEKEATRLASLPKKKVLEIVQDLAKNTKHAHACVEKASSLRKADLVEAILTCQEKV